MVSIILPCRNERESIEHSVKEALETLHKNGLEGEVVVSDSSQDGSAEIARAAGAKVIRHNREGYGLAVKEGLKEAKGDIIVLADGDATYDLEKLPDMIRELDGSDIVIGSRLKGHIEKGAMPFLHKRFGTPFINLLLFLIFGIKTSDSQSGFRAFKSKTIKELDSEIKSSAFTYNTEMFIKAKRMGLKIKEIPVNYRARKGSSKLKTYRDGTDNAKYIFMLSPFCLYLVPGVLLILLGITDLFFESLVPGLLNRATVKILFPLLGIQIVFLGLFAKTYAYTKLGEKIDFIRRIYQERKLRLFLLLGILLVVIPAILKVMGLAGMHFDILLVSALAGLQIIFNTIILSTLSIK